MKLGCSVPQRYELLYTLFDGLAFAIRFLRLYGAKQTFSDIKRVMEHMTKMNNDEISQISKLFQTRLKTFYESNSHEEDVDVPSLVVDSFTNPDSTVLKVSFSGPLDALTDTACSNSLISMQIYNNCILSYLINGLKQLGLDVAKQTITHTRVSVTQTSTGRKVENSDLLNTLLTTISDLLK
nr:hypothetical protein [Tanacetum cinerariifolium]